MSTPPIFKLLQISLLLLFVLFGVPTLARAQAITLQGRVLFSYTGEPAAGATVTMKKSFYDFSPPEISTETTVADSSGNYFFTSEARCAVSYEFEAVSSEIVDDEPLPHATNSTSGCVLRDTIIPDLQIVRPHLIILGGIVSDEEFRPVQGLTVTMTRTKYDLTPNVVATDTTTTDGAGHYQFIVYSRCAIVEAFQVSLNGVVFHGGASISGCVLSTDDHLDIGIEMFSNLENAGRTPCNTGVAKPINVTNGNMYLQQTDYLLPGAGDAIVLTRTYNSISTRVGLFGRGWTTSYDETISEDSEGRLRLAMSDGHLITFATPDFFGQMVKNGDGSYTVTFKDGRIHQFNPAGRLVSQTDRQSNQTTLAYDQNGKLTSVTDTFGRTLFVTTNASGRVLSISDAMGTIANYTYGPDDLLLSVTYADNSLFQFSYSPALLLTTVTDALGNVVEQHDYDPQGRATSSETHGGVERYTLNYVSLSETDVTDALGHVTRYFYSNIRGRRVVVRVEGNCSCGNSQVQTWTYDDRANVTTKTDALNHTTTFTYDGNGNRLTSTDSTGTVAFTYNQFGNVLTVTDQMGGLTAITYDAQGNLLSGTNPLGKTTSFTSDSRGQLLSVTDARGKLTSFVYDSSGRLIVGTDALNHATQYGYDARARLTSMTNALGHPTALGYDSVGRPTQVTQADGSIINYEYDRGGRLTAMTDAKGNRTTYAYDGAGRLTGETDALNQAMSYGYDLMSSLTARTDAMGRVTNYEYDDFNRLKKIIYSPATTGATRLFEMVGYDAAGNVVNRTDTAGRATGYAYDDVNRVVSTTDAANKVTRFEYDALGRTTALVDALSQRYRFNYDAAGQLRHVRRGTTVMSFTYDAVGNRKQRTDYNGVLTTYDYDAVNRLKIINYPDTTTVNYTYDKLSRLQTATNENGVVNFDYNKMNRMTSVTDVFGQAVDYNYDLNGNRTKLSLDGTVTETYRYDAIDRLTKILDAASATFNFTYDSTSKLTSLKAPNGVTATYQYDGLDRLTRLTNKKGQTTVADFQYQLNDANNISQITELASTNNYSYDAVDRLAAATHSNQPNESYVYDGVGNRTSSTLSATYGYQPFNQLVSTASATYSYDTNGNLISKTDPGGSTQYSWDFENRLTQVTLPNGKVVTYKYDALGRRIERSASAPLSPTTTERYIYDGADIIRDTDGNGATLADYLNGPGIDNKLRQTTTTGSLYYVQDHLGSTRALTDATGNLIEQQQYDSFGNSSGSTRTRYGYTGRERDPDTGLYYYRARFYDPQVGRFISEDPIGLSGGINQFAYGGNNPQNVTDPSGLHEIDVHYYLTYFLAKHTGCFSDAAARLIADADQGVDDNPGTAPWPGDTPRQRAVNASFHALHEGAQEGVGSPTLRRWALTGRTNYVGEGTYMHYFQDTYAHSGYHSTIYGHLFGGHSPDKTASDPEKAFRMAIASWSELREYARQKGCKCVGDISDVPWNTVWRFILASGGPGYREIDDRELENKRAILGVPPR